MAVTGSARMFDELADKDGWCPPPEGGSCPVTDEEFLDNIRINLGRKLPSQRIEKVHDRIMIMVCGGPSSKMLLEEIRERSKDQNCDIFCSNATHDWLISNGITPKYHFIIDPKKSKIDDVKHPNKAVKYLIGVSCNPGVFDALEGYDVSFTYPFSNIGNNHSDLQLVRMFKQLADRPPLHGGTMAGLRAMTLADIMGYRTVEFYGFDSCFFEYDENGRPVHYSYKKEREEDIYEAKTKDGTIFLTTPVFASQARQFLKWRERLEWIKFIVHGPGLTAALDKEYTEENKGVDYLISDGYKEMLKQLHSGDDTFGISTAIWAREVVFMVGQLAKKVSPCDVLDYGSGKGMLAKMMPNIQGVSVRLYDPANDDPTPEPAEMVVCTDVLEHIEPECLNAVLRELQRLTKSAAYITIHLSKAEKTLPDGRNAHLIVKKPWWWISKIKKYFAILEAEESGPWLKLVVSRGRS